VRRVESIIGYSLVAARGPSDRRPALFQYFGAVAKDILSAI
jgi:hypothetical protein